MQQCLADIAVEQRNAADTERAQRKRDQQQRFFPSVSADLVEVQLSEVHHKHARSHEQSQLDQRMIDHVEDQAAVRQFHALPRQMHGFFRKGRFSFAHSGEENSRSGADQDKADLGHGRAGQCALQIDAEQGQDSAESHGDRAGQQDHKAKGCIAEKPGHGSHQDAEDPHLGQDAGEQGRRR